MKEDILKQVRKAEKINAHNSMGCDESWYNPYYAIKQVFSLEELEQMSESELNNLVKLAKAICEAFY